jgi:hypothetical protein
MSETMVALTVIGLVAPFIAIVTFQIFQERKEARKINYKKWEKKFFKRNPEMRLKPEQLKPEQDKKGMLDLLTNLDKDKIKGILGALQDKTYEDEEGPEQDKISQIISIAQQNPELVEAFLNKLGSGKSDGPNDEMFFNS